MGKRARGMGSSGHDPVSSDAWIVQKLMARAAVTFHDPIDCT